MDWTIERVRRAAIVGWVKSPDAARQFCAMASRDFAHAVKMTGLDRVGKGARETAQMARP